MQYHLILLILVIGVLAWCPWLSKEEAVKLVDERIAELQAEKEDLCAMFIDRDSVKKTFFGYTEKVSYDCSVNDPENGIPQSTNVVFITFYKGLIDVPSKTVNGHY